MSKAQHTDVSTDPATNGKPVLPTDGVSTIVEHWGRVWPELDVSPLEVFGRLHRSFLLYRAAINTQFDKVGTTEPGFDVLAALRRAEPNFTLTAGELAEQTLVTTGGLTLRVNRLEKEGLVTRHRDTGDQRVVHVRLTATGLRTIERAAEAHYANLNRLLHDMTPDEISELATLLGKLFNSIVAAEPGLYPREA